MSFRLKIILGIALIQTILLVAIIWSAQLLMYRSHENELRQRGNTAARLFSTTTKDAVLSMDLASLKSFVEDIVTNNDVAYAKVVDRKNKLLAAAGPRELLDAEFIEDRKIEDMKKDGVFDVSSKIEEGGIVYGEVQIGILPRSILVALRKAMVQIIYLALGEILLSIFLSALLGAYLIRRLDYLREASDRVSEGEIGYQINVSGKDEIAVVTRAFNHMSSYLKTLLDEISIKNRSLEKEINKRIETEKKLEDAREKLEKRDA